MRKLKFRRGVQVAGWLMVVSVLWGVTCSSASARKRLPNWKGEAGPAVIPLPPMGWSSWNSFSNTVDSKLIVQQAKALVTTGLRAWGYQYVNIDEGWWQGRRDEQSDIVVDAKQWPALRSNERAGDMANIVRYIHSLGLRAGIYTDVGKGGCSTWYPDLGPGWPGTGSEGHYDQDFQQFAQWGFDFVKVDWCGGFKEELNPVVPYTEIAQAIRKPEADTGHSLYYSICDWGQDHPWTWAPGIGGVPADIWRTSGDIAVPIVAHSTDSSRTIDFSKVLANFTNGLHPEAQHTGYYNDLDMLVIGMPGMSQERDRVHMSLWSISGAPLIIGADITQLNKATLAILMNRDAISVDQDPLGLQGVDLSRPESGLEVVAKRLAGRGRRAVVFLNETHSPAAMSVTWKALGLQPSASAEVWDVWSHREAGAYNSSYSVTVPPEDVVMVLIKGTEGSGTRYDSPSLTDRGNKATFAGVRSEGLHAVKVVYTNDSAGTSVAGLEVNGSFVTKVAFPSTGRHPEYVVIEVPFGLPASGNTLTFTDLSGKGIALRTVTVLAGRV